MKTNLPLMQRWRDRQLSLGGQYLARGVANIAFEAGGTIDGFVPLRVSTPRLRHDSQGYKKALTHLVMQLFVMSELLKASNS